MVPLSAVMAKGEPKVGETTERNANFIARRCEMNASEAAGRDVAAGLQRKPAPREMIGKRDHPVERIAVRMSALPRQNRFTADE